jgi:hypothetical protein
LCNFISNEEEDKDDDSVYPKNRWSTKKKYHYVIYYRS